MAASELLGVSTLPELSKRIEAVELFEDVLICLTGSDDPVTPPELQQMNASLGTSRSMCVVLDYNFNEEAIANLRQLLITDKQKKVLARYFPDQHTLQIDHHFERKLEDFDLEYSTEFDTHDHPNASTTVLVRSFVQRLFSSDFTQEFLMLDETGQIVDATDFLNSIHNDLANKEYTIFDSHTDQDSAGATFLLAGWDSFGNISDLLCAAALDSDHYANHQEPKVQNLVAAVTAVEKTRNIHRILNIIGHHLLPELFHVQDQPELNQRIEEYLITRNRSQELVENAIEISTGVYFLKLEKDDKFDAAACYGAFSLKFEKQGTGKTAPTLIIARPTSKPPVNPSGEIIPGELYTFWIRSRKDLTHVAIPLEMSIGFRGRKGAGGSGRQFMLYSELTGKNHLSTAPGQKGTNQGVYIADSGKLNTVVQDLSDILEGKFDAQTPAQWVHNVIKKRFPDAQEITVNIDDTELSHNPFRASSVKRLTVQYQIQDETYSHELVIRELQHQKATRSTIREIFVQELVAQAGLPAPKIEDWQVMTNKTYVLYPAFEHVENINKYLDEIIAMWQSWQQISSDQLKLLALELPTISAQDHFDTINTTIQELQAKGLTIPAIVFPANLVYPLGFAHRHLTPRNVLVGKRRDIVLTDFQNSALTFCAEDAAILIANIAINNLDLALNLFLDPRLRTFENGAITSDTQLDFFTAKRCLEQMLFNQQKIDDIHTDQDEKELSRTKQNFFLQFLHYIQGAKEESDKQKLSQMHRELTEHMRRVRGDSRYQKIQEEYGVVS